jgi:hypothetical protein
MSAKLLRSWPEGHRPGWDVMIELIDGERRQCVTFYWPEKEQPTEKILAEKLAKFDADFIAEGLIKPEVIMTKTEVEKILIDKGYLSAGQSLDDLATKEVI